MEQVTVGLADETLTALDELAEREHHGDRDEAARELLDEWIERR